MQPRIGTGDAGDTSLFSGKRVPKNDSRIEAVGNTDELLSHLAILRCQNLEPESEKILRELPHMIFDIGGEIAGEGKFRADNITEEEVEKMTEWIRFLDEKMPELREFMLPSGVESAQWLNLVRAVVRRLERTLFPLLEDAVLRPEIFAFVNRLSRLLFSLERWENYRKNGKEEKWEKGRKLPRTSESE